MKSSDARIPPPIYLLHECINQLRLIHFLHRLSLSEDNSCTSSARNAEVGFPRFPRPVHRTTHHCYLDVKRELSHPLFHFPVSYTHLRAHETDSYLVCRLLLEKKKKKQPTL